ncbi:MAG: hypothetical protein KAR42_08510 [candidate division Zixibacteria bacterium]|nr:hypothetical protein [candidate division Zixibacteria bacterium]
MYKFYFSFIILSLVCLNGFVLCQDEINDNTPADTNKVIMTSGNVVDTLESRLVGNILDTTIIIPQLEFVGLQLDDALKALVRAYELSVFIDTSVTGIITLRLDQVSLNDALLFIIKEYDLDWERTGEIIKIYKPAQPVPPPPPLEIEIDKGKISYNLSQASLQRIVDELIEKARINIVIESSTNGRLSGKLIDVPLDKGLDVLFSSNGFILRVAEDIYYISSQMESGNGRGKASRFSIRCDKDLVTINVTNAPLGDVISTIGNQCGASFFTKGTIEGSISANFVDLSLDEALGSLLRNTQYTYKKDKGIFFFGAKTSEDMFVSELILLKHLVAKDVEPLVPPFLTKQVSLKVIIEHNGFVAVGPKTVIDELRLFLNSIDIPPAMVLFDVLVIDYVNTDSYKFDILMNDSFSPDSSYAESYYPSITISGSGNTLNDELDWLGNRLGISKIGPLSDNFFAQLQIMQLEGKANVRSRPKIASLCGHSASINVGTTQYYLLETQTVHSNTSSTGSTQTSQRFETIEANMKIEVTPYVNETGELIVDIKPEFSTPSGKFDPDVPPTISHRILESTVRMKNGETIILGGLVQSTESKSIKKFPILGSLPLIGWIFRSTSSTTNTSELMIYITPHVYYGSEQNIDLDSIIKKD